MKGAEGMMEVLLMISLLFNIALSCCGLYLSLELQKKDKDEKEAGE